MEALSPTMEEGRLVSWKKKEGDVVTAGEVLAEVETDKAVMDLVARGAGVLRKIILQEGTTVPVSALVAVIGGKDEDISALIGGSTDGGTGGSKQPETPSPAPAPQPAAAAPTPQAPPATIAPSPPAPSAGRTL